MLLQRMKEKKVSQADIARALKISANSVNQKINGYHDWRRKEMIAIRDKFFPESTLDELFVF